MTMNLSRSLLALMGAGAVAVLATPALADEAVPFCSAKVTDNCMQRPAGHTAAHKKAMRHHKVAKAAAKHKVTKRKA
ncbi:hypothetical protein H7F51_10330 [Novosphingobium flavum]|uniref:Uncharacterized protein n=1 Tax=Novosphingobium flavum TaxID=1778672 RepID=A0A7X1KLT5_9SPHN|nr:hypothetical protein [Novosphingobium flavum]MBC2665922.1 hypothetical protein [Novosphingobium flavum]